VIVGALLLAAGGSRRFGDAKQLALVGGRPMVAATVAIIEVAGLPLLLVTGANAAAVTAAVPGVPAVHAEAHAGGLAESLKAGLAAAPANWGAALVMLADMPFVRSETLVLLARALAGGAPAVVPVCAGRRGNPAGFTRALWPRLMALRGDRGAGPILDELGVVDVEVEDPGIHRDVDVPADLSAPVPPSAR
jgi:molybdenum cofactor cytidylyltransferase